MGVGADLLSLATSSGSRVIFVVGTGRDAGKTTTLRAVYGAARGGNLRVGLASFGRDRGSQENATGTKPRLWLMAGTVFVSARGWLPQSPACRILGVSSLQSPGGNIVFAGVETGAMFDVTGPPTAAAMRDAIRDLTRYSDLVLVDGAVDRIAAVAGIESSIVVAVGAADAATVVEAASEIGGLVARLRVPPFDSGQPRIDIPGALTEPIATELIGRREMRQVVVQDPTQIALRSRAAVEALSRLKVRCVSPLRVVAASVASIAAQRQFEPVEFGNAVAAATGLPTFDVYRGTRVA